MKLKDYSIEELIKLVEERNKYIMDNLISNCKDRRYVTLTNELNKRLQKDFEKGLILENKGKIVYPL